MFATPNGAIFLLQCGFDSIGGDLFNVPAVDLAQCLATCSTTPKCVQVSLASTTCYLKSSSRNGAKRSWIQGAKLVNVVPAPSSTSSQSSVASLVYESTSSTSTSSSVLALSEPVETPSSSSTALSTPTFTPIAYDGSDFQRPTTSSTTSTSSSTRNLPATSSATTSRLSGTSSGALTCATQPVQNPSFDNGLSSWGTSATNGIPPKFSISNDVCSAYSGQNAV